MQTKETITLSGVPETMLQTVYARAKETKTRGAITDNKAVEIIDRLDYDFSMADKDAAMHSGVIARTIVLDKLVKTYLAGHGGAVVVNIACGLDTRCYRMSDYSHWYNLDLPETIAVREKLLPESRKISQITMSAMDDWGGEIKGTSTDVLVIIEGLTMYLSESDVKRIFDVIAARFDRATVLVETMNPMVVKRFKEKSIEASKAKFTWGVKNGAALAALLPDFRFVEEHSLCEGMAEFVSPMDQIITTCSIKFATRRALRRCWIASSSKTSCRRCRFCESEEKRMKRNYIIAAFRETVAQQFPEQSVELNRLLDEKLSRLRSMHLNASKGKQFHLARHRCLRDLADRHAQGRGAANRPRLCGGACVDDEKNHPQAAPCAGDLPAASGAVQQADAKILRRDGGLCGHGVSDLRRRLAHRYDEVPLSRHLCRTRLSGALPLLLRQRRHRL